MGLDMVPPFPSLVVILKAACRPFPWGVAAVRAGVKGGAEF